MSTNPQAEDHAVPTNERWIAVVICQADDPCAQDDAKLIAGVLQHVGLCTKIFEFFDKTKQEVLDGLDEAVDCMKQSGALRILVCYFGRAYCRHLEGSTWMDVKDSVLSLECAVSKALRQANLENATQVIIADNCQDIARYSAWDEHASGDSDEELPLSFSSSSGDRDKELLSVSVPSSRLYSTENNWSTGDTGHFASALAYCLLCRLPSVSELFREVKDLVFQLTFFRQRCRFLDSSDSYWPKINLFLPQSYVRPVGCISERHFKKCRNLLQNELLFLARWLCELSGNELCRLKLDPTVCMKETEGVIRLLKDINDQLLEKARLFQGNLWFQQLNMIHDCKDLHQVLAWLRKRPVPPENQDAPQEQLCRPCYITPDIQKCLLESLKNGVKDEFDEEFANLPDDPKGKSRVEMAADLWERLSEYFDEYHGKLFPTNDGAVMKCTYAIYAEGVKTIEVAQDLDLNRTAMEINEMSKVFDIDTKKYRVFLHPGSLWIIIRSDTRLQQLKKFMDGLAKWYEQRCDAKTHWERAKAPRRVPLSTAPQRLLNLVMQVENCPDFGCCMWLRAADLQALALKRMSEGREHGNRLERWQVAVFDGHIEAEGRSW